MRTNIVIDDKLMQAVMSTGEYKTKREAVEAGLRLIQRRNTYDGLIALRGKLQWDDSDEYWANVRAQNAGQAQAAQAQAAQAQAAQAQQRPAVHEPVAKYKVKRKAKP